MKKQLKKFISGILLLSLGFSLVPLYSDNPCVDDSNVESICEMTQEMVCCNMDKMEKESCQCPEMTKQDTPEKEDIPAIPATTVSKLIATFQVVIVNDLSAASSSKRNYVLSNSAHYSNLGNKIYKKINTFLI